MKKILIEYINGNAKGQQRLMSEKIAKILIKSGRVIEVKEQKDIYGTKELKTKAKTKGTKK
jgi:hypothetical protein